MRFNKKRLSGLFFKILPIVIILIFFGAYGTLSIVRHNNYQSFGYDLGINSQTVWKYSNFQTPISTISSLPDKPKYYQHVELVYALVAPFYWIWESRKMLLLVEIGFICSSSLAVFLLARSKKLKYSLSIVVMLGFLTFYGVQNAVWFDVHSSSFAAAFLAWFLYFFSSKKIKSALLFFILAITAKENIAFITLFIGIMYLIARRDKYSLLITVFSFIYLFFIFFIYFPHIVDINYVYQNESGILSNLNPLYFINTTEKIHTIFYTLFSAGFIPLLLPFTLIPMVADLGTYFVIGSELPGAQGLFMHYRITLAPLLSWAIIITIVKFKKLNNKYTAIYLLICLAITQYTLHLPLSYLSKKWFWTEPAAVKDINYVIKNYLPNAASVVSQNNITPHISHRNNIYTLYPEKKKFEDSSFCGNVECDWFRWYKNQEYLIVDKSIDWDARHLLTDRENYIKGLENLENAGIVERYREKGNTVLYKIVKNPEIRSLSD